MLKEAIIGCDRGRQTGNTDSEGGDSLVDCLLLRNLSCRVSRAQVKKPVSAHLVVGNGLSKLINETCHLSRICRLVNKPSGRPFFQQFLRSLFDSFQRATKKIDQDKRGRESVGIPGQLQASIGLCLVSTTRCYIRVLPESI